MIIIKKNFKNNKFLYYFKGFISLLIPKFLFKNKLQSLLISIPDDKLEYILKRVNYYNKLESKISTNKSWSKLNKTDRLKLINNFVEVETNEKDIDKSKLEKLLHTSFKNNLLKKLAPPLVTLLSSEAEVQYVALRNINLIVQKKPEILKHEIKVFFVKYNDPIYVKLEKLDIMIRLASPHNIAQVGFERYFKNVPFVKFK